MTKTRVPVYPTAQPIPFPLDKARKEAETAQREAEEATKAAVFNELIFKAQVIEDRTAGFRLAELARELDKNDPRIISQLDKHTYSILGHNNTVQAVRFAPDGKKLVSASYDGTAKVWSLEGKELLSDQCG